MKDYNKMTDHELIKTGKPVEEGSEKNSCDFEEKRSEKLLILQRDLSIFLASTSNLEEAFHKILEVICQIDYIDCGGIYLADRITGDLNLTAHRGLSSEFIKKVSSIKGNILRNRPLKTGIPVYTPAARYDVFKYIMISEGLHAICVIPVLYTEQLIALLNLASHKYDDIPHNTRHAIETIASQIGSVIIRLRNNKLLEESQQNLQLFFDTMDDFLIIADLNGNILHFNPALERISGYSSGELSGMHLSHIFEKKEEVNEILSTASLKGKSMFYMSLMTERGVFIHVETKITMGTWNNQNAFFCISRDITDRIKSEESIKYRLSIEELITDISTAFINIASSGIDREIHISLEKIGNFFDVDRAFLNIFSEDGLIVKYVYEWSNPAVKPLSEKFMNFSHDTLKWFMNKLRHFEYIDFSSTSELPSEAINEIKIFREFGVKSGLVIPLILKNSLVGWIGFNMGRKERTWQEEDIKLLRMAGEIFLRLLERKWTEEALRESEEKYSYLLNASSVVIYACEISGDYRTVFISENVKNILGYEQEEFLGDPDLWRKHIHRDDRKGTVAIIVELLEKGSLIFEYRFRHKNGTYLWLYDELNLLYDEKGNPEKIIGHLIDLTERKVAEGELIKYRTHLEELVDERTVELKKLLEEKEILLKEIHHRVKNNLQIISSLLYLQSSYVEDKSILDILRESQTRIKSIGLVHEKLYQSENFARINFKKYIYDLSSYLFITYSINTDVIRLNIESGTIYLAIDKAIPCGLIINELLTNALKYAFPDGRKGEISIRFYKENGFILHFRDNGTGLPEDIDIEKLSSLGLKLLVNLTEQIDGKLEIDRKEGTSFKITFPYN